MAQLQPTLFYRISLFINQSPKLTPILFILGGPTMISDYLFSSANALESPPRLQLKFIVDIKHQYYYYIIININYYVLVILQTDIGFLVAYIIMAFLSVYVTCKFLFMKLYIVTCS